MLGPTGIGVLYGKKNCYKICTFLYGGEMIREVKFDSTTFNELPWKFEAGTPNMAEGIGLGAAVDYLQNIGMEKIQKRDKELADYAVEKMKAVKGVEIFDT